MIKKNFSGNNSVGLILAPDSFKDKIFASCPDIVEKYDVEKAFFAECYEKELAFFPLVVLKLVSKNDNTQIDYACYVPQTAEVRFWNGKLSYRKLSNRDIAYPVEMLYNGAIIHGKIAKDNGKLVFRFRV